MWQPEQCCRGIKPLTEYKWENLRDSSLEQIICHCQVCIVSASFLKKAFARFTANVAVVPQKEKRDSACSSETLL